MGITVLSHPSVQEGVLVCDALRLSRRSVGDV